MIDFSAIDVGTIAAAVGTFLGSYKVASKAKSEAKDAKDRAEAIAKDREVTKIERDTKIALLEAKCSEMEKRLNEGNDRFERFEKELKETNGMLRELIGMFKGMSNTVTELMKNVGT